VTSALGGCAVADKGESSHGYLPVLLDDAKARVDRAFSSGLARDIDRHFLVMLTGHVLFGTRLYFGLGEDEHIDTIEVDWIGGHKTMVHDIKPDRIINISE